MVAVRIAFLWLGLQVYSIHSGTDSSTDKTLACEPPFVTAGMFLWSSPQKQFVYHLGAFKSILSQSSRTRLLRQESDRRLRSNHLNSEDSQDRSASKK
ncbi:hypothetical protein BJX68DRAFT_231715 [Aspergillus pseudodeflectus]|uniref:Secreted protein n=1 Tax=Aspergillus pseudodeflectus TaxID=176178 RepID=A0ABR4KSE3_9EURO